MQQPQLRRINLRIILTAIAVEPGITSAELSRLTGLAPQTVSTLVGELVRDGLVKRREVLRGRRGQPATPLELDPRGAYGFGCLVSWRHLEVVLVDLGLAIHGRHRMDYDVLDPVGVVDEIATTVARLSKALPRTDRTRIAGIGLASPTGRVDNTGHLQPPVDQLPMWATLDLPGRVGVATGLPARWFNDGSAACWADLVSLSGDRPTSFMTISIGTFVGAGIMAENRLWVGPTDSSADLGAMLVVDAAGRSDFAHRIASLYGFELRLRAAGLPLPPGPPQTWPWADLEPHVSLWIDDAAEALARVVLNTGAVIETDRAIIGGDLPPAQIERLVERTHERIQALPLFTLVPPRVTISRVGPSASAIGAAELTMFRRYFSRDLTDLFEE